MRVLAIVLFALMLSGCTLLTSLLTTSSAIQFAALSAESTAKAADTPSLFTLASYSLPLPAPVIIYTTVASLADKPFRDLGEVSGDACQLTPQDPPPTIPLAQRHMQLSAEKIKANIVLQHRCEIMSGTPGCYRQAVCIGSALQVTD